MDRLARYHIVWIMLLFTYAMSGCEEHANPLVGEERPFTLFGYLNPKASNQTIRVIPIENTFAIQESIDAQVFSVDLNTSEEQQWKDSLVTFEDGEIGHVFVSSFQPEYNHTYRLEVVRSDGALSSVEVTVPPEIRMLPGQQVGVNFPYILEIEEQPNIVQAEVRYVGAALQPLLNPILHPVNVSYRSTEMRTAGGWEININMINDVQVIKEEFEKVCLTTKWIKMRSMALHVFIGDSSWVPPGGEFDERALIQPNVFSNVENGFGFFGAGYSLDTAVRPSGAARATAGFSTTAPCADVPPDDPSCEVIPPCFGDE